MKNPNNPATRHQEFVISDIMPRREVHLICGPSGVGKTNLSLAGLKELQSGGSWLERNIPSAVEIFYISVDRSKDSVKRAFDRHHISHSSFPWTVEEDVPKGISGVRAHDVLSWIHTTYPSVEFIFIDGFASLLGENLNDYGKVSDFLRLCRHSCLVNNLTILGSAHSPKMRNDESIPNPRQRVMGSAAWAGFSDLIIVVDPEDEADQDNPNRIVRVLPRDAAEYSLLFRNEKGILIPIPPEDTDSRIQKLESEIELAEPGTTYTTSELSILLDIPKRSFMRWLALACASGLLVKVSRGTYQRFGAETVN